MKSVLCALVAVALAAVALHAAETCFYKSESTSDQNRICTYSCPSGAYVMTLKIYQLCPVTVSR